MDIDALQVMPWHHQIKTVDSDGRWVQAVALVMAFLPEERKDSRQPERGPDDPPRTKMYYVKQCGAWVPCTDVVEVER